MLLRTIVEKKAAQLYGNPLPAVIRERVDKELVQIRKSKAVNKWHGAFKLMQACRLYDDLIAYPDPTFYPYLTAFLLGIIQTNPLPSHHVCPGCCRLEFTEGEKAEDELGRKTCVCGEEMRRLGFNLQFDPDAQWEPAFQTAPKSKEALQAIINTLPLEQRGLTVRTDPRLDLLQDMLQSAEIGFWELPVYDGECLRLFSRPLLSEYAENSALGIREIVSNSSMIKLCRQVNAHCMNDVIKLSGCALLGPDYAECVREGICKGKVFEDIVTFSDDFCSKLDDQVSPIFHSRFPPKALCMQNALQAIAFSYIKINAPSAFYAICAETMWPELWDNCPQSLDISLRDAWERANNMLQIRQPIPARVASFEELANHLAWCAKRTNVAFWEEGLLLLAEISYLGVTQDVWDCIDDPLFF